MLELEKSDQWDQWVHKIHSILYSILQVSPVKYYTKAISTFHQINAFEEDGFLMIDLCCADGGQAISNYLIQNLRKTGEALDEVSVIKSGLRKDTLIDYPSKWCDAALLLF